MPTPVNNARDCLTEEAARALDDAVSVARRRSHSQTTSLHLISALLNMPNSPLRAACSFARAAEVPTRLQLRALELSIGVALDRLPCSKSVGEDASPSVSNALMAAIKRSQANQRRHPDAFGLYGAHSQQYVSNLASVKVELKHLILSVLDDPVVNRVFMESGFRSSDLKLAVLRPVMSVVNSASRFSFPFGLENGSEGEDYCRRIGEILVKKKARNPLLIGVSANNVLEKFNECLQSGKTDNVLPRELSGLGLVNVGKDISEFFEGVACEEMMRLRFEEVRGMVESCDGAGVVVNYGDLKVFVENGSSDALSYVVSELSKLVQVCGGKSWLIGAVGSYETYMKFSAKFPSIESDWDVNMLPITSTTSIGGSSPKSSFMGSFVPFGGFFPGLSELKNLPSSPSQSMTRCNMCNEKYENEVSAMLKAGSTASVADYQSASSTSWLRTAELDTSNGLNAIETKDHGSIENATRVGLQKKWNDICQRLQHTRSSQDVSKVCAYTGGLGSVHFESHRIDGNSNHSLLNKRASKSPEPSIHDNLQPPISPEADESNFRNKQPLDFFANAKCRDTSSTSVSSVTTDLGLGTLYGSSERESRQVKFQDSRENVQNFSVPISREADNANNRASSQMAIPSHSTGVNFLGQLEDKDFKQIYSFLMEKVRWQENAIRTISETISRCRTGGRKPRGSSCRGDIWFTFLGPDKMGKRKIAAALAQLIFGNEECFFSVDLDSNRQLCSPNSIFDCNRMDLNDPGFRGRTVSDYIVEELRKKPHSVVVLENIDKADFLDQCAFSKAIQTGKLRDSHCREISINQAIFVATSSKETKENPFSWKKISEERILGTRGLQMQILVESIDRDANEMNCSNVLLVPRKTMCCSSSNKRNIIETSEFEISLPAMKIPRTCLDLNLPVEETAENSQDNENDDESEAKDVWWEEFLDQVDEKVVFESFDFNALAEKVLKEIGICFQERIGSGVMLEIETEVLVQILAFSWISDRERILEGWIERVLCVGFIEAKKKYVINSQSVVKLLVMKDLPLKEPVPYICLPDKILLN